MVPTNELMNTTDYNPHACYGACDRQNVVEISCRLFFIKPSSASHRVCPSRYDGGDMNVLARGAFVLRCALQPHALGFLLFSLLFVGAFGLNHLG